MIVDVRECVGPDNNVRHFTRDSLFTLCGELLGKPDRDGPFESCGSCIPMVDLARQGYWYDFASSPGHVLVKFPS